MCQQRSMHRKEPEQQFSHLLLTVLIQHSPKANKTSPEAAPSVRDYPRSSCEIPDASV